MSSTIIKLTKVSSHEWQMIAPKGHTIGPRYRGDEYKALEWAIAFISSWNGWVIELDKGQNDDSTD